MRRIMIWLFVLLIPISAAAQNDECLRKGQVITVLIPSGADVRDGASFAGTQIYATDLDAVSADGWGNRLPRVVSLPFEKIGDKGGFEELELRGNLWFKVRFTSRALFEQYAVCGPADGIAAEDRLEEIFAAVGEAAFANVQVTPDLRTELARYAYTLEAGFDGRRQPGLEPAPHAVRGYRQHRYAYTLEAGFDGRRQWAGRARASSARSSWQGKKLKTK